MSNNFHELVTQMNYLFKLPVNKFPTLNGKTNDEIIKNLENFKKILQDEVNELDIIIKNLKEHSELYSGLPLLTDLADFLADLTIYCRSEAIKYGLPLDEVLDLVMKSNFSKSDKDGKPIYDNFNKVLKGPYYWNPEQKIRELINEKYFNEEEKHQVKIILSNIKNCNYVYQITDKNDPNIAYNVYYKNNKLILDNSIRGVFENKLNDSKPVWSFDYDKIDLNNIQDYTLFSTLKQLLKYINYFIYDGYTLNFANGDFKLPNQTLTLNTNHLNKIVIDGTKWIIPKLGSGVEIIFTKPSKVTIKLDEKDPDPKKTIEELRHLVKNSKPIDLQSSSIDEQWERDLIALQNLSSKHLLEPSSNDKISLPKNNLYSPPSVEDFYKEVSETYLGRELKNLHLFKDNILILNIINEFNIVIGNELITFFKSKYSEELCKLGIILNNTKNPYGSFIFNDNSGPRTRTIKCFILYLDNELYLHSKSKVISINSLDIKDVSIFKDIFDMWEDLEIRHDISFIDGVAIKLVSSTAPIPLNSLIKGSGFKSPFFYYIYKRLGII